MWIVAEMQGQQMRVCRHTHKYYNGIESFLQVYDKSFTAKSALLGGNMKKLWKTLAFF